MENAVTEMKELAPMYGYSRSVQLGFDETMDRIKESLTNEGFGVLTEIDLKEKFKEKMDEDFRRYTILGACNPPLAFKALSEDLNLGLLLPCNVVVFEDEDRTMVSVIDAKKMMSVTENPALEPFADEVNEKLRRALDGLAKF